MDWQCILSFYIPLLLFKSCFARVCSNTTTRLHGKPVKIQYCCINFVMKNGQCEECPIGFTTTDRKDKECKQCQHNLYGHRCLEKCFCKENERCHHEQGCVSRSNSDGVMSPKSTIPNKDGTASETGSSSAVVAYMSIIATIGAVVVIGIATWKNKEFLQKKLKKQKIRFPRLQRSTDDVSGKEKSEKTTTRKSEHLYDDINEKYMIKDF